MKGGDQAAAELLHREKDGVGTDEHPNETEQRPAEAPVHHAAHQFDRLAGEKGDGNLQRLEEHQDEGAPYAEAGDKFLQSGGGILAGKDRKEGIPVRKKEAGNENGHEGDDAPGDPGDGAFDGCLVLHSGVVLSGGSSTFHFKIIPFNCQEKKCLTVLFLQEILRKFRFFGLLRQNL